MVNELFKTDPVTFRNTELAFRSDILKPLEESGYVSILIEGSERTLKGKSPGYLYKAAAPGKMKILTRNQDYSGLFTCRKVASSKKKIKFPDIQSVLQNLEAEKSELVNIWFDLECMGEHLKASTGIFGYFENFVKAALKSGKIRFILPATAAKELTPKGNIEVFSPVTWHEKSNDISAWNGNAMQIEPMKYIYGLEKKLKATGDERLIEAWRRLQSSDHLLYMDTEESNGSRPAQQFSPFKSPHEAYVYLMNALASLDIEAGSES